MTTAALLIFSYLLGSFPIGLIVGKLVRGIDVREFGSHNIGATNVWRTLGPACGITVFILDVAKGLIPVLASHHTRQFSAWLPVLAGLGAILGHNFSPFLKFKGGKGVATSLGVAFGLSWLAALIGFGTWSLALLVTRYISVASMIGTAAGAFFIWWLNQKQLPDGLFAILSTIFVFVKHKANLGRLKAGTEPKVGRSAPPAVTPPSEAISQ